MPTSHTSTSSPDCDSFADFFCGGCQIPQSDHGFGNLQLLCCWEAAKPFFSRAVVNLYIPDVAILEYVQSVAAENATRRMPGTDSHMSYSLLHGLGFRV